LKKLVYFERNMSIHDFRSIGLSDELSQPGSMYKSSQEGEDVPEAGEHEDHSTSDAEEGREDLDGNLPSMALRASEMEEDNGKVGPLPSFESKKRRYKNQSRHASLEFSRKDLGKIASMINDDSGGPPANSGSSLRQVGIHNNSPSMHKSGSPAWLEGSHQSQYSMSGLHSQSGSNVHSRRETGNNETFFHSRNESNYVHFGGSLGHSRQQSIYSAAGSDMGDDNYNHEDLKNRNTELQYQLHDAELANQDLHEALEDLEDWITTTGKPAVEKLNSVTQEVENTRKEYELMIESLNEQLKEKQKTINNLEMEKVQWEKTNTELQEQLNEWQQQQLNDDNQALTNAKGEVQESIEELRRERVRLANTREKYTEQTTRMGKLTVMVSQLQHEKKTMSQEIHNFNAQKRKHERAAQEWKDQLDRAREEIAQLNDTIDQQRADHHRELQNASSNRLQSSDRPRFRDSVSGQSLQSGRLCRESVLTSRESILSSNVLLPLADSFNQHHRKRSGSVHSIASDSGHRRSISQRSESLSTHKKRDKSSTKTRPRRAQTLHNAHNEKLMRVIADLKTTTVSQSEEHMSKQLSRQVLGEVQRSLKTFVQSELVDVVKEVFSDNPAINTSIRLKGAASPSLKSGAKDVAKEVFKEETENFAKTLETFEVLCSKIDKDMLNSLSQTNNKLVDSLSASREWFASFKNHIETVTNSHMDDVKAAISKVGANHGDIKFDTKTLGEMIRESTVELLKKNLEAGLMNPDTPAGFSGNGVEKVKSQDEQRKVEALEEEIKKLNIQNEDLTSSLMQAGRDKLMAMSRLNEEIEKLRTYVRQLKSGSLTHSTMNRKGGGYRSGYESREYSQSPRDSLISWAWT